jgi:hypothetical protein
LDISIIRGQDWIAKNPHRPARDIEERKMDGGEAGRSQVRLI